MKHLHTFILLACLVFCNAGAQPSGLDSSFGVNGMTVYAVPPGYAATYNSLALQPDGKIISCGLNSGLCILARYLPTGALDNSFATQGMYTRPYEPNGFLSFDMVLQPDGSIVAGGQNANGFALLKFTNNGKVDSSFGSNGITSANNGQNYFSAMVLQPDGKIVTMGTVDGPNGYSIAMIRFHSNGIVDSSFGINGRVSTNTGGNYGANPGAITMQADGKILVGTQAYDPVTQASTFCCLRYLTDGTLDGSFGGTGISYVSSGVFYDYIKAITVQTDGRILIGGGSNGLKILRLKTDGSTDSSFGTNGFAFADTCVASCMALRSNGNIVVGGYTDNNNEDWTIMEFKPNGTLDSSFGQYGKIFTPIGGYNERMLGVLLQPDGKIVSCGQSEKNSQHATNAVIARYQSDGRLIVPNISHGTEPDITLYPQPADGLLHIYTTANTVPKGAVLYSIDGRCIADLAINNNTLNVASYPDGLYLITLRLSPFSSPITRKIIIHH